MAALSYLLTLGIVNDFSPENKMPWIMTPLVFLQILVIGGALGEEFGWRGFAQLKMEKITSHFNVSLLIGVIWSIWHLPLFFMDGTVQSNIPIWQFMLQNTLMAFFYTWLYHKTRGNLWLIIYLHAIANTASALFPYWQNNTGRYIGFAIMLIGCLMLYIIKPIDKKMHNE